MNLTENTFLSFPDALDESPNSETCEKAKEDDKSQRARLRLALSEGYLDQLELKEAKKPLQETLELIGDTSSTHGTFS